MSGSVLVLNAGSSSIKFALYEVRALALLCRGEIGAIGSDAYFEVSGPRSDVFGKALSLPKDTNHETAAAWVVEMIHRIPKFDVMAAGHRVVHGGARFEAPVLINDAVTAELERLTPLAPGHQPRNIAAIRAVAKVWGELPQVACFDTAFHRTQPRLAQLFPLPRQLTDEGIVRYGFHGLSYEYIADILPDVAGGRADGRVIIAHLGHGASLCAMKGRKSIATTMGFTALDGLMMGTRCGTIDPGIILHLIRERGLSVGEVSDILNNQSGLLGVSGLSDDVRVLEASGDPRASEALDLFAYRARCEIGSLMAALGGLDVLVFTAGIGENAAGVRREICRDMPWAGVTLDAAKNNRSERRISSDQSGVDVYVVPTNEELPIARATRDCLMVR